MKKRNLNILKVALMAFSVVGLAFISSCGSDDGSITPTAVSSTIGFSNGALTIQEGETGTATISFAAAAPAAGTFTVNVTSDNATYTTDYTTDPSSESRSISYAVKEGDNTASISIVTVNNNTADGNKTLTFTLVAGEGINLNDTPSITVTIADDDTPATTIQSLRDSYNGETNVIIESGKVIEGVVTSVVGPTNEQNIFLQDASGAIVLRFNEAHSFARGDELRINVGGLTIGNRFGVVRITETTGDEGTPLSLDKASKIKDGTLPEPEVITLEQLKTDDYQSKLVKIENVSLDEADGMATFSGNSTMNDGSNTATLRAFFTEEALPLGSGDAVGLASVFRGVGQLLPQARADVFADNPSGVMTIGGTLDNFGEVANGANSEERTFTITVSEGALTSDVVVTAPTNFQVSLTGSPSRQTFEESVTIPFANANAGVQTIYVRFSPTSGVDGALSGDIKIESRAAATKTIAVSGTETGNGASTSTLKINEFHYDDDNSNGNADSNEFVEIVVTGDDLASASLSNYRVVRYNGSDNNMYTDGNLEASSKTLDQFTRTEDSGNFYYVWNLSPNGLQNGGKDGLALVGPSGVIEFISYEGTLTAGDGPAVGVTSTDVGVAESSSTPVNSSIQRKSDNTWELTEGTNTKGTKNPNE